MWYHARSGAISAGQVRSATVRDFCPALIAPDRAWYHTWNSVLLAANLDDGSFFLSRVVLWYWKKVQDKGLGVPCREKPLEKSGLEPAAPNRLADRKHCALSSHPNPIYYDSSSHIFKIFYATWWINRNNKKIMHRAGPPLSLSPPPPPPSIIHLLSLSLSHTISVFVLCLSRKTLMSGWRRRQFGTLQIALDTGLGPLCVFANEKAEEGNSILYFGEIEGLWQVLQIIISPLRKRFHYHTLTVFFWDEKENSVQWSFFTCSWCSSKREFCK